MPRLQPPLGYTTARDAATRLGVSDGLLSRYVNEGKLHRYGPEARKHKFYKISEIEALRETERVFSAYETGMWRNHPASTFRVATENDMPAIIDISNRIFNVNGPFPSDPRLSWLRTNAEIFHILESQEGVIVGYASVLPLKKATIDQFVRDEIQFEQLTADKIQSYTPGSTIDLYLMSLCVDPNCTPLQKHMYGARLVAGLFAFLLDLADRGIEIVTITARSHKPDGIRLLRKMGFPQLRSPNRDKLLYSVTIAESGFSLFVRYSETLDQWKQEHGSTTTKPKRSRSIRKQTSIDAPAPLPDQKLWGERPS